MILLFIALFGIAEAGPDRCAEIRGHQRQLAARGVVSEELDALLVVCTGGSAPVVARAERAEAPQRVTASSTTPGPLPVKGVLTSRFGWRDYPLAPSRRQFHKGVDIGAPKGTPVHAAGAGVVLAAGKDGGHGKTVRLGHPDGVETVYSHLSSIHVRVGEPVRRGDRIGRVGSTGASTGPHLHFGVFVDGEATDPAAHPLYAPALEAR